MSEVQQITKANFIRLGIAAFKEHELREIVATFCKLPGIAPAAQAPLKLGDLVCMAKGTPFYHDWRGAEMKIVSLRIEPDGKQWASVIDKPYGQHRGYGYYDGETTEIDCAHLEKASSLPSADRCCPGGCMFTPCRAASAVPLPAAALQGPKQHGWPVGTRVCDCVTGEVEPGACHCERASQVTSTNTSADCEGGK